MNRALVSLLVCGLAVGSGCLQGPAPSPTSSPSPTGTPLETKTTAAFVKIEFNGSDVVAILRNLSDQPIDVSSWQLCSGDFVYGKPAKEKTSLPARADVRIHVNAPSTCTETDTEFCPGANAGVTAQAGNVAIYTGTGFTNKDQIVDFVSWGTTARSGVPREDVAVKAALWQSGTFVQVSGTQPSISVKVPGASGAANWQ